MLVVLGLVIVLSLAGFIGGFTLTLETKTVADWVRLVPDNALSPGWARLLPRLTAVLSTLAFIVIGILFWRRLDWKWLALGAILMFIVSAAVHGDYGLIFTNLGEIIFMLSLIWTDARVNQVVVI